MTKDAPLQDGLLVDELVDVVDDIRREVHGALGTRRWSVSIVTRRWSGDERGVGTPTITVLELDPRPLVKRSTRDRLGPAGREAAGSIILTGVSLRYTEKELQPKVDGRTEVAYRMIDTSAQRQKPVWGVLSADPVARHGDHPGDATDWYIVLNETSPMGEFDGVDAP